MASPATPAPRDYERRTSDALIALVRVLARQAAREALSAEPSSALADPVTPSSKPRGQNG
jgi:hypothetical protein